MRVVIAAIGKLKDGGERELFKRYSNRFDQAGRALALGPLTMVELAESKLAGVALRKADEAARLLKVAAGSEILIVLDEHGSHYATTVFANRLAKLRDDGVGSLAFLLGGPDGHAEDVLTASPFNLALGHMTLPHGLARVILAEQLYRATTILSGHPYHRA